MPRGSAGAGRGVGVAVVTGSALAAPGTDPALDLVDRRVEATGGGDVVAGGVGVAGVEAEAEPGRPAQRRADGAHLGEVAADDVAGAGAVLHEEPGRRLVAQHLLQS